MPSRARTSRTSPRFASWCIRCVLLSSLVSCNKGTGDSASPKNKLCAAALADGRHTEARTWLADPRTIGFDVSKDRMREVAEAFYAAGAPKVSSAWNDLDGAQISALFVVALPAERAARTRIIARYNDLAPALGLDLERDDGQTCLLVSFGEAGPDDPPPPE